jgi:asparagine synthase (glutamine-hydrolysing)
MPGFFVSSFKNLETELKNVFDENCIKGELKNNSFTIKRNTLNKFADDKLFSENGDFVVITEGVLLNKTTLMEKYCQKDFFETIIFMFKNCPNFCDEFIGSFSGAIFEKSAERWTVFTDKTAAKPIFYYYDKKNFAAASQVNYLLNTLKLSKIPLSFDSQAAYSILTYGYMYDGRTFAKEIKRLEPGALLTFDKSGFKKTFYWKLTNDKFSLKDKNEDEIIDLLDKKFSEAVKLEFKKDDEYGLQHFADLSGGFDARMVNFAAKKLGYKNVLDLHYSQSGSTEETVSKEIAAYLGNTILIRPLDNASFLFDFKKIVSMNFGLALYSGITGGESLFSSLKCENFGIEHTGMIGDVVIGSFLNSADEQNLHEPSGMYSKKLADKVDSDYVKNYPNFEIQKMYVRAFNGACSTFLIRQNFTEAYAPFLNPCFLEFCMSIPLEMRVKHQLYNKWVLKKYPDAADFVWTSTGTKITHNALSTKIISFALRAGSKIKSLFSKKARACEMNPFQFWYSKNPDIKKEFDNYFQRNIDNPIFSESLKKDMTFLFKSGSVQEKTQVITVLAATDYYFGEN